ncbi:MAG: hypothetical protein HOH73_03465 [Alphaproteobacteria bacterium]|jgi:hypothetical protein|nr:hypothetical protein [Alphaproteobacteria bacterium]
MVKRLLTTIFFLALLTLNLNAQNFEATINKTNFAANEDIILTLTLLDINTKNKPNIEVLNKAGFRIRSQSYNSKTSYVNGEISKKFSWVYYLSTNLEGQVTIPEITLQTKNSDLKTSALKLTIAKNSVTKNHKQDKISISNQIETKNPFIKQTVILKTKIVRFVNSYNEEFIEPKSNDAIIELISEPKSYRSTLNNQEAIITEYIFALTPIKTGEIKITSAKYKGVLAKNHAQDSFGNINNLFGFSNMQKYEDFFIASNDIILNVKDRISASKNWLPLNSLKLKTELSNKTQNIYVGDPIELSITLEAHNAKEGQIPDLEFLRNKNYKIYKDQAENNITFVNDKITLTKIQNFTLVPINSGEINIPAISINWFNLKTKKYKEEKSKSFTFNILPELEKRNITFLENQNDQPLNEQEYNNKANIIIVFLIFIVLVLIVIVILLASKLSKLKKHNRVQLPKEIISKINLSNINKAKNINELKEFIFFYFVNNYKIKTKNLIDLDIIIKKNFLHTTNFSEVIANINAAIYANLEIDLTSLKSRAKDAINTLSLKKTKTSTKLHIKLNP